MTSRRAARPEGASPEEADLAPVVGGNLRRLRGERGLSLEALAKLSGVSRAMLGQIELGHSAPTINILWKIAKALDLPFSALISHAPQEGGPRVLRATSTKRLLSADGRFASRALFPFDEPRKVELYELAIAPGGEERAEAHAAGTRENLVVANGSVEIIVAGQSYRLSDGDAIVFDADVAHAYRNVGEREAILYLVMTYAELVR